MIYTKFPVQLVYISYKFIWGLYDLVICTYQP